MLFDLPGMWLQDIQSQTSLHLAFGEGAVQAADWFLAGLTMEGIEIRVAFMFFGHNESQSRIAGRSKVSKYSEPSVFFLNCDDFSVFQLWLGMCNTMGR